MAALKKTRIEPNPADYPMGILPPATIRARMDSSYVLPKPGSLRDFHAQSRKKPPHMAQAVRSDMAFVLDLDCLHRERKQNITRSQVNLRQDRENVEAMLGDYGVRNVNWRAINMLYTLMRYHSDLMRALGIANEGLTYKERTKLRNLPVYALEHGEVMRYGLLRVGVHTLAGDMARILDHMKERGERRSDMIGDLSIKLDDIESRTPAPHYIVEVPFANAQDGLFQDPQDRWASREFRLAGRRARLTIDTEGKPWLEHRLRKAKGRCFIAAPFNEIATLTALARTEPGDRMNIPLAIRNRGQVITRPKAEPAARPIKPIDPQQLNLNFLGIH